MKGYAELLYMRARLACLWHYALHFFSVEHYEIELGISGWPALLSCSCGREFFRDNILLEFMAAQSYDEMFEDGVTRTLFQLAAQRMRAKTVEARA